MMMEVNRSIVISSLFWKFFERFSTQIVSFVVTILLARLLLPEEYGAVALISIFINICNVIIDGGLNTALIQKNKADNTDFSTIFYFSIFISIVLYITLFIFAPFVSAFYNKPILNNVIRVLGLNLIFYAVNSIQRAYVSKHMLFKKLLYSSFVSVILSGILGVYLAYRGYGIWALVGQSLSSSLVTCIVMWFTIKWRPIFFFSIKRFISLFDYGWKIFLANFITIVFVEIRKLFIGKLYSPSSLAYYEKGEFLPNLVMTNIFTSIQTILLPTLSGVQDDNLRVKSMMRRATKMSCFVIYPITAGMIVVADSLVNFLLGSNWMGAVPFIQIMCIANFFRPITIANWEAIKALGHSGITLKLEIIKKIVDITILLISINIGVFAIAWGVVLFNSICVFINLAPNIRLLNYKIKEQVLDALPTLFISILMGGIIHCISFMEISDLATLVIQIMLGCLSYCTLCFIFKEESFLYILQLVKDYRKIRYNK